LFSQISWWLSSLICLIQFTAISWYNLISYFSFGSPTD
jgi:hypothetical protein